MDWPKLPQLRPTAWVRRGIINSLKTLVAPWGMDPKEQLQVSPVNKISTNGPTLNIFAFTDRS